MKGGPIKTGLRIVAGEWRGRKLATPEGENTRPTADRTRETLFSMLASRLGTFEGLKVADLFADRARSDSRRFHAARRTACSWTRIRQPSARSAPTLPTCRHRAKAMSGQVR